METTSSDLVLAPQHSGVPDTPKTLVANFQNILKRLAGSLVKPGQNATTASRMLHGISWQLIAMPVTRALTFSIAVLQARLLGKAGYGELGMALSTLSFFNLFAASAAGNTCTKFIAELRYSNPRRAERICGVSLQATILLALIASIAAYALAPFVAASILSDPGITELLRFCSFALVVQTVEGTLTGILYGFQSFRSASIANGFQVAAWLPLTYVLTRRYGVSGAMWAFTLSHLLCALMLGISAFRELRSANFRIPWRASWHEAGVLWEYSLPMMLHGILCVPTIWITNALLARQPSGFSQLGAYNAAFQFRTAVVQVPMLLQGIAMPFFSELSGESNSGRFSRLFDSLMRVSWAAGLLAAMAVSLFAQPLMQLFGREFRSDSSVLAIVMAVAATSLVSSLAGNALQANGMVWKALWANVAYAVSSIVMAWLLIPTLLGLGLALAFVASTSLQAFLLLLMLAKKFYTIEFRLYLILGSLSTIVISALAFPTFLIRAVCIVASIGAVVMAGVPGLLAKLKSQLESAPA